MASRPEVGVRGRGGGRSHPSCRIEHKSFPFSPAGSASALLFVEMSNSSLQWGHFWGPKRDRGGIMCEDLKEGPQMRVGTKYHIEIGVRGQQFPREMCFDAHRGTVSLNPKDEG